MVFFFDSSAIVKRYVQESGSAWVLQLSAPASGHRIYVAAITGVEVVSALACRGKQNQALAGQMTLPLARFRHEFVSRFSRIDSSGIIIDRAMRLAETYALRGYDAVQLAAGLHVHQARLALNQPGIMFVSAAAALNSAAAAEGLPVGDPNDHP